MSESSFEARLMQRMSAAETPATPGLADLRKAALTAFGRSGLPTRRIEEWKYSDLARALADEQIPDETVKPPLAVLGARLAAFEDGVFDEAASRLESPDVVPLRRVLADPFSPFAELIGRTNPQKDHAVVNLNAALMEDGLVLHVPAGRKEDVPIHLRFRWGEAGTTADEGRHLRILVVMDDGAHATLVESHDGNPGFVSIVTELKLAPRARLTHVRLERFGPGARQTAVSLGALGADAGYRGIYFSEGGQFVRHEALMRLEGERAEVVVDGAYLVAGTRHCDNTTVITHAVPRTTSRQAFRGVLAGEGRGVYQGKVTVSPKAQGTDARQSSRALLLSHKALIATKPELEILADDVKCAHGASVGDLDANAVFFLRSRGIPEAEARALLIEAFLGESLEAIPDEGLKTLVLSQVSDWLLAHAREVSHVD
jgi:Fe-S cluster assembly protein SufD